MKSKYRELRDDVMDETGFRLDKKRKEIRQEMYRRNSDLVVQTEWVRMASRPMFSHLLGKLWLEPTVFHGSFALVSVGWTLVFRFTDLRTSEFKKLKEQIAGYDDSDLRPYLCCQKVIEQTHVYVISFWI